MELAPAMQHPHGIGPSSSETFHWTLAAPRDLDVLRCACLRERIAEVSQATRARMAEVVAELRSEADGGFEDAAQMLERLAKDLECGH